MNKSFLTFMERTLSPDNYRHTVDYFLAMYCLNDGPMPPLALYKTLGKSSLHSIKRSLDKLLEAGVIRLGPKGYKLVKRPAFLADREPFVYLLNIRRHFHYAGLTQVGAKHVYIMYKIIKSGPLNIDEAGFGRDSLNIRHALRRLVRVRLLRTYRDGRNIIYSPTIGALELIKDYNPYVEV